LCNKPIFRDHSTVTFAEESVDAAEAGVVGLDGVGVEFEYEAALWRVVFGLCERRAISTQREARRRTLGHLRSLQVDVQVYIVRTPAQ